MRLAVQRIMKEECYVSMEFSEEISKPKNQNEKVRFYQDFVEAGYYGQTAQVEGS